MYCLRCGNETKEGRIFCDACLKNMERYPVKPGTPVKIPHRDPNPAVKKQPRRKTFTPEEQIIRLRVHIRTLLAILGASLIILTVFAFLYFQEISKPDPKTVKEESASIIFENF